MTALNLKYGCENIRFSLPEDIPREILRSKAPAGLKNPEDAVLKALRSPVGTAPLREKVQAGKTVCIIVNDSTRVAL